jgi:ABC-type multidrug transport system fused ATPase/permease subunit
VLRDMGRILRVTGGGRRFLFLLLLRSPFDTASTLIQAAFLQRAFSAVGRNDASGLTLACVTLGVGSLCLFVYNGAVWSVYAPFVTRMEGKLRIALFGRIASFPYERIESVPQGEWLTRLNADVEMPFGRSVHLPHAASAAVSIGVSAAILWHVSPAAFGWVMLFAVPHIAVSQLLIARAMPALSKTSLEATAENTGELAALIVCADVAALYDGQDYLMRRFEQGSLALYRANMRVRARNALGAAIVPLSGLGGYMALLLVGGGWIAAGRADFGDLAATLQYRGGVVLGSLMLMNSLVSIGASMAGIRRLNATMHEGTEGVEWVTP